jgi:ABC-type uncharacterized transport system substrate-binding protein
LFWVVAYQGQNIGQFMLKENTMKGKLKGIYLLIVAGFLIATQIPAMAIAEDKSSPSEPVRPEKTFRILHIMSFDSPWRWTDGQFAGFKEGLGDVKAEYQVFQMDVKRNTSPEAKETKEKEARALIESWKPDLVYTSDDDAQQYVTRHYVNDSLPFVFSGVNKDPQAHGIDGARNVTGVLEQEHIVESIKLLQTMLPQAKRLAVITDPTPHWTQVIARIQSKMAQLPGTTLAAIDVVKTFDEFKEKVLAYPVQADAVIYLGNYALKDDQGNSVPYQEVQKWVCQNSKLPEISFWIDRINYGVLAAVTVSEREQGLAAGRLARAILVDGKPLSSLPMQPTLIGHPAINLARAKQLGIKVKSSVLLTAEVVTNFAWEKSK